MGEPRSEDWALCARTSGCVVAVCVGWVLELRKHVGIWSFCHNLLCLLDSLAHSLQTKRRRRIHCQQGGAKQRR
eukprot:363841-Chlamydomonas_euryale.AAC.5